MKRLFLLLLWIIIPAAFAYQVTLNSVTGMIPEANKPLPPSAKIMVGDSYDHELIARYFLLSHLPATYEPLVQAGILWAGVVYYRPHCNSSLYVLNCPYGIRLNRNYQLDINVIKAPDETCHNGVVDCRWMKL